MACARPPVPGQAAGRSGHRQGGSAASQRPRPRSRAEGGRTHASPAISPRRLRSRHRAMCMRAAVGRSSGSWIREPGLRASAAASRDHRPSACATSFPPTAAGQRRDWRAHRWSRPLPYRLPFSSRALWRGNRRDTTYRGTANPSTPYMGVAVAASTGGAGRGSPWTASRSAAMRCARRRRPGARRHTARAARRRRCRPA